MKTSFRFLSAFAALVLLAAPAFARTLAEELFAEGQYDASSIEFRRLALAADDPAEEAAWLWNAAHALSQPDDVRTGRRALDLLDAAEDAAPPGGDGFALPLAFLRAELSLRLRDTAAARYYYRSLADAIPASSDPAEAAAWRECASRGAAAAALAAGDLDAARAEAEGWPDALAAVESYAAVPRKSPVLGGILGIVPGAGYLYSGEYGNALRSLLLNSLFVWAMVETACEDQWALFGVSAFLETTWFTGSIYGGIDAAHRRNREALALATAELKPFSAATVAPDAAAFPVLHLSIPLPAR